MTDRDDWQPFDWYCVNCGTLVTGFRNSNGDIKVECKRCKTAMVRKLKTPRHDVFDVYAPKDTVRIRA